jgi:hypothetical protein
MLRAPLADGDPPGAPIAIREASCPRREILSEVWTFTASANL